MAYGEPMTAYAVIDLIPIFIYGLLALMVPPNIVWFGFMQLPIKALNSLCSNVITLEILRTMQFLPGRTNPSDQWSGPAD